MEVPEVPILIGNLIVPIVALLGALLLAWAMLADVLDLCRIVGEVAYDVGTLYEVASSLPGDVLIHYAGPTECIWDGSNINCSFFNITETGITTTQKTVPIYTLGVLYKNFARYFTSYVKVNFASKYADEYNLPNPQTYYVYRGISKPIPRNDKVIFSQGGNEIQIKKEGLEDPITLIYNKAFEIKRAYTSSNNPVEGNVTVILSPYENLSANNEKLCILKKIEILPGDLSMVNDTTNDIYILEAGSTQPENIDLEKFKSVEVYAEASSSEVCIRTDSTDNCYRDVIKIWYYKLDDCVNFKDVFGDSTTISINKSCNLEVEDYFPKKITMNYDGSSLSVKCGNP